MKQAFKVNTNVPLNLTNVTNYFHRPASLNTEFILLVEAFWETMDSILTDNFEKIQLDKLDMVLIHMTYGNITFRRFIKFFKALCPYILKNLNQLNFSQISAIVYSYARLRIYECNYFFESLESHLINRISQNFDKNSWYIMISIKWAYSKVGVYSKNLFSILDNYILNLEETITPDSLCEFYNALTLIPNFEKLENIENFLLKNLQENEKNLLTSHYFVLAYSCLCIQTEKKEIWSIFLKKIIESFEKKYSLFQIHHTYLIYIHLFLNPVLSENHKKELDKLQEILALEKTKLFEYVNFKKPKTISDEQVTVMKLVEENANELFKNEKKDEKNFIETKGKKFYFYENFKEYEKDLLNNFPQNELFIPYSLDYRYNDKIFEHNGLIHYYDDLEDKSKKLNGITMLKKRFLESLGMNVIEIPYYIAHDKDLIIKILKNKLKKEETS